MVGNGGKEEEKGTISLLVISYIFVPTGLSASLYHILRYLTL